MNLLKKLVKEFMKMNKYVDLAFAEERHVQASVIINTAFLDRLENIHSDETDFRVALTAHAQAKIDFISTDALYDYKAEFDTDTDGTVDLVKSNFNYDEILEANLDVVKAAASVEAAKIAGCTYENGALTFPTV